jgi:predicted CxxxxCH...CXXCH cytochrome family protein
MTTYEVWTIGPDCAERYVGLVDGETRDRAEAVAGELHSHGNPGGLELREQPRWYDTGLGGCCSACEEAGHVLGGHFACSPPQRAREGYDPAPLPGVLELTSELREGRWALLVLATSAAAAAPYGRRWEPIEVQP